MIKHERLNSRDWASREYVFFFLLYSCSEDYEHDVVRLCIMFRNPNMFFSLAT